MVIRFVDKNGKELNSIKNSVRDVLPKQYLRLGNLYFVVYPPELRRCLGRIYSDNEDYFVEMLNNSLEPEEKGFYESHRDNDRFYIPPSKNIKLELGAYDIEIKEYDKERVLLRVGKVIERRKPKKWKGMMKH